MKKAKISPAKMAKLQKELTRCSLKLTMGSGGFYAAVYYNLHKSFDVNVATACTDGKTILINPDFFMELNEKEKIFLLAHEVLHVCFLHMIRSGDRDPYIWNCAGDYVINLLLTKSPDSFGTPINGILLDKKYEGMTTEQVYDKLIEDRNASKTNTKLDFESRKKDDNSNCSNSNNNTSNSNNNNSQSCNKGSENNSDNNEDNNNSQNSASSSQIPLCEDVSYKRLKVGKSGNDASKEESSSIDFDEIKDMIIAASQCANTDSFKSSSTSNITSTWGTGIAEIDSMLSLWLKPKIKWQDALYEYINIRTRESYNWSHRDRRFRDVYLPRLFSMGVGRMVVYIDESGSIGDQDVHRFLSEINAIKELLNPELIDIIPFTDDIMLHKKLTIGCDDPMPKYFSRRFTGGTNCQPIFNHMLKSDYNVRIVLTDGYFWDSFLEEPKYSGVDMVWCIINNNRFECKVGKVLHITTN